MSRSISCNFYLLDCFLVKFLAYFQNIRLITLYNIFRIMNYCKKYLSKKIFFIIPRKQRSIICRCTRILQSNAFTYISNAHKRFTVTSSSSRFLRGLYRNCSLRSVYLWFNYRNGNCERRREFCLAVQWETIHPITKFWSRVPRLRSN